MKTKTALLLMIFFILLATASGLLLWQKLPQLMASHWNSQDQVDGYIPRLWGVFLMPLITALMMVFFLIIPHIDPLATNIERFRGSFNNFIVLVVAFMLYIHLLTLIYNLGYTFAMSRAMLPALGVLIFAAGVLVSNAQPNWFIGIRTPWTLSNTIVWDKTHRLGGILFKIGGVLIVLGLFFGKYTFWFVMVTILIAAFVPVLYSYFLFRKFQRQKVLRN
ncbi:MAG: SdpI family protein [Anaerolineales bacterium]